MGRGEPGGAGGGGVAGGGAAGHHEVSTVQYSTVPVACANFVLCNWFAQSRRRRPLLGLTYDLIVCVLTRRRPY